MKNQFKETALKILFILFFINNLNAQNVKSKFEIKFYLDRNSIAMESENGNNWNTLFVKSKSFNLDQNGMVNLDRNLTKEDNSNYLFSIITLIGKKGTEWKKLVFELPEKGSFVTITENGIKT